MKVEGSVTVAPPEKVDGSYATPVWALLEPPVAFTFCQSSAALFFVALPSSSNGLVLLTSPPLAQTSPATAQVMAAPRQIFLKSPHPVIESSSAKTNAWRAGGGKAARRPHTPVSPVSAPEPRARRFPRLRRCAKKPMDAVILAVVTRTGKAIFRIYSLTDCFPIWDVCQDESW